MTDKIIEIEKIEKNNDRKMGGFGNLQVLARDLEENGQINPISVIETEDGYRIITGRRRLEAAELLGWKEIRATVYESRELDSDKEIAIALSENVNREEMDAIDEGLLYAFLMEKQGKTAQELAKRFNRSTSAIYQRAKLSKLSQDWQHIIKEEGISLDIAAKIACLKPETQQKIFERCDKEETWNPYYINLFISEETNTVIGKFYYCEACDKCEKRTHFENNLLFPELNYRDNICLDSECYQKQWAKAINEQFTDWLEEQENIPDNIAILADDEEVPENIKTQAIDRAGLQLGDNIYSWYTYNDIQEIFEYELKDLNEDNFYSEKVFPVIVIAAGRKNDASYYFYIKKVMTKADYQGWRKTKQMNDTAGEKQLVEIYMDSLEDCQDKLKEIKKRYLTWEVKNKATDKLLIKMVKDASKTSKTLIDEDLMLLAINASDKEKKEWGETDANGTWIVKRDLIDFILQKRLLKKYINVDSLINSNCILSPEAQDIYERILDTKLNQDELLNLAKEALKEAIQEE